MRNMRILGGVAVILVATGVTWYVFRHADTQPASLAEVADLPTSPRDAAYVIEGYEIKLTDGRGRREFGVETGSEPPYTMELTYVGEPVVADVNVDGIPDALGTVVAQTGGSGSFYYAVVALSDGQGYLGSNGILLGDRIAEPTLRIENDLIVARYRTHAEDEPMTAEPSATTRKYLTNSGIELRDASPDAGDEVVEGTLVRDGEGYVLRPCGGEPLQLSPESRSYAAIDAVYGERAGDATTTSVFFVLAGTRTQAAADDERGVFDATLIMSAPNNGVCTAQPSEATTEAGAAPEAEESATGTAGDLTDDEAALE